jgi:hypothetical protein
VRAPGEESDTMSDKDKGEAPRRPEPRSPESLEEPVTAPSGASAAAADGGDGRGNGGKVFVQMGRAAAGPPSDQRFFWSKIREGTTRIGFPPYEDFINGLFCVNPAYYAGIKELEPVRARNRQLGPHVAGVAAYQLLKTATEAFLLLHCGVVMRNDEFFGSHLVADPAERAALRERERREEERRHLETLSIGDVIAGLERYLGSRLDSLRVLPYFENVVKNSFSLGDLGAKHPLCEGILDARISVDSAPCLLELIWSYWHEEGMLVQALNMIARRFQNRLDPAGRNPLSVLNLDPLRPMSNLIWGYVQDEYSRLSIQRRAYEYDHHYGMTLYGKAVQPLQSADSRTKFIEAFHHLLHRTTFFYRQDDDTTVIADGFPVLQALKEVHLLLAQGAHNQFGDLPWTARVEMLIQKWLLARPEIGQFLNSRPMVPYTEGWMAQADTLKKMFGWHDTSVSHFRDLGVFGEQLLLSARYANWLEINEPALAAEWARYWRPEVQSYVHAYRAATGADLTVEPVDTTAPSVLLRDRSKTHAGAM